MGRNWTARAHKPLLHGRGGVARELSFAFCHRARMLGGQIEISAKQEL